MELGKVSSPFCPRRQQEKIVSPVQTPPLPLVSPLQATGGSLRSLTGRRPPGPAPPPLHLQQSRSHKRRTGAVHSLTWNSTRSSLPLISRYPPLAPSPPPPPLPHPSSPPSMRGMPSPEPRRGWCWWLGGGMRERRRGEMGGGS